MKKLALFALALVAALAAPRADAQFSLIPYAGYNLDAEGAVVGIGGEFAAPFSAGSLVLAIRPSVEYIFTETIENPLGDDISSTALQINGDVITRFAASGSIQPYAGAGLAIYYFNQDEIDLGFGVTTGGSSTDIGLNILGGVEFPGVVGFGDPFVQGRLTLADGSAIAILAGLSIPLGQ